MSETFIEAVLTGQALWDEADDWVERWHEKDTGNELHEYLGLRWDDYSLWTERPETLRIIIAAYELDEPVLDFLAHANDVAVAARGLNAADRRAVVKWLEQTGRLSPE